MNTKKTIAIYGFGHVGRAMFRIFKDQIKAIMDPTAGVTELQDRKIVTVTTKTHTYIEMVNNSVAINDKAKADECDFAFICVPTPVGDDGKCDTSIVENVVENLSKTQIGIIKSTVEPRTTENLGFKYGKRLVFSPEYFGESSYYLPPEWSERAWPFHIFGGYVTETQECVELFKPLFNPRTTFVQTNARTAELVKYMENCWGAMKVTWANEWYDICEKSGVSYDDVREFWALDPRVEKMHTSVFKYNRGYGGKCFPKDIKALVAYAKKIGVDPVVHETIDKTNEKRTAEKI